MARSTRAWRSATTRARTALPIRKIPRSRVWNLDELFKLQFEVTDLAGNVYKTPLQGARWDNIANPPGVFGVYSEHQLHAGPRPDRFRPLCERHDRHDQPDRLAYRLARTNYAKQIYQDNNLYGMIQRCFNSSPFEALNTAYPNKFKRMGIAKCSKELLEFKRKLH